MINVAIYSRKSRFSDTGESIQNQIELCREYAQHHFQVNEFFIYQDHGYSGGNTLRPKYQELLEDLPKGKFQLLICYRLDRISRSILDFSKLVELLERYDIQFVSLRESFDTSTPMGRAMMYISSVFAQLERETIAQRIRDNMHQLARRGRWLGGRTPFGFESQEMSYPDEQGRIRRICHLVPVEEELRLVGLLYQRYLEYPNLNGLVRWAREHHMVTRSGKAFDSSSLRFILSNPVYVKGDERLYHYFTQKGADMASPLEEFDGDHGPMVYNRHQEGKGDRFRRNDISQWIVAMGSHRGIIPSEDWIAVQRGLEERGQSPPRRGTGEQGLITGLLRCGNCGSGMRISVHRRGPKTYYYYRCALKESSKGRGCNMVNLNGRLADQRVLEAIMGTPLDRDVLLEEIQRQYQQFLLYYPRAMDKGKELESQRRKCQEGLDNLASQLAQSKDSEVGQYLLERMGELIKKIQDLDQDLKGLEEKEEEFDPSTLQPLFDLLKGSASLTYQERKEPIVGCIREILWDGKSLSIRPLESFLPFGGYR